MSGTSSIHPVPASPAETISTEGIDHVASDRDDAVASLPPLDLMFAAMGLCDWVWRSTVRVAHSDTAGLEGPTEGVLVADPGH